MRLGLIGLFFVVNVAVRSAATTIEETMRKYQLVELAHTFDTRKIDRLLPANADWVEPRDRASVAVLLAVGLVEGSALENSLSLAAELDQTFHQFGGSAKAVRVSLDNVSSLMRLIEMKGYAELRRATDLTRELDKAIAEEVLTGYGLRRPHVSEETDATRTVIYSHSSLPHVKQLVGLVASEGLKGRVYIAPKIAAFVFRDGWGERPEWINELGPGLYVAQGPEMLVHFEFEHADDRLRFDDLVDRCAKKDTEGESGNLIRSWWQPFYYGETPAEGYHEIRRVILFAEHAEASLLMLPGRTGIVRDHFMDTNWEMQTDSIWVSAPFYRFLQGDYK